MDQHPSVKILEGNYVDPCRFDQLFLSSRQLLSYGRRLPLHELDARIDVRCILLITYRSVSLFL